ncbi:MAG: ATP-binding cassette domain-containing protein [Rhodoferax sp.]|nr:ATP-binding cassette domain-containing protein [Rhodoferax sp.]
MNDTSSTAPATRATVKAGWDARQANDLSHTLGLTEHLAKPLYMLSAGSRRKVGLVAAAASSADLILLDQPFAALDAASCQQLIRLLVQAARQSRSAWVVADYEVPPGWPAGQSDRRIELGG